MEAAEDTRSASASTRRTLRRVTRDDGEIDRLVVQQYDPGLKVTTGGIDTCLRGVLDYAPPGLELAVVGIDTSGAAAVGRWQTVRWGNRQIRFLPVAQIDTTRPKGASHTRRGLSSVCCATESGFREPGQCRLTASMLACSPACCFADHWSTASTPRSAACSGLRPIRIGALRAACTSGWTGRSCEGRPESSCSTRHTPKRCGGGTPVPSPRQRGSTPRCCCRRTNPQTRTESCGWAGSRYRRTQNSRFAPSPCWCVRRRRAVDARSGRLRYPSYCAGGPDRRAAARCAPAGHAAWPALPGDVAEARSRSGVLFMTSHAGYEGFPRVLVEGMAAGLPAVVTEGSDTGGLIQQGVSGFVCGRDPAELAGAVRTARGLDHGKVAEAVAALSAPRVVREVFFPDSPAPATP